MIGFMIVSAFLAFPVRSASQTVSDALLLFSGVLMVGAVLVGIKGMQSRYDLKLLHEFHETEAIRKSEPQEEGEFDSVYCMVCGEAYDMRLPFCPNCRSPQGGAPCG